MILLRRLLGDALRRNRLRQHRTLREVSAAARVSLGYLSEVERGQKEASSELLTAICDALDVRLADVLREVSEALDFAELSGAPAAPAPVEVSVPAGPRTPVRTVGFAPAGFGRGSAPVPAASVAARPVRASAAVHVPSAPRVTVPVATLGDAARPGASTPGIATVAA